MLNATENAVCNLNFIGGLNFYYPVKFQAALESQTNTNLMVKYNGKKQISTARRY